MKHLSKIIILVLVIAIIGLGILIYQSIETEKVVEVQSAEYNSIEKICELATLEAYYHNVAEFKQNSEKWFNVGYKKYWIEYDGIVKIGIDVNKIQINPVDENNNIKIYIPEPKIMDIDSDTISMREPITDKGAFTKITTEDKATGYSQAQAEMEKKASEDENVMGQAKENAKNLIAEYVRNINKQINKEVTIEWINEPI